MRVEPFGNLSRAANGALSTEGARLATFLAPETGSRDVRFHPIGNMP